MLGRPVSSSQQDYTASYYGALVVLFVGIFLLGYRFFSLQVVDGESYAELSRVSRVSSERVPARRGLIKDRKGRVLAQNVDEHVLEIYPRSLENVESALEWLRDRLEIADTEFKELWLRVSTALDKGRRTSIRINRQLMAEHCPSDQQLMTPLPAEEQLTYSWCSECGRRYYGHEKGKKRCPIDGGGRLKRSELDHGVAYVCSEKDIFLSNEAVCPHDGNPLRKHFLRSDDLGPGALRTHQFECADGSRHNNEVAIIAAQLHQLPGVELRAKMRRQYPSGSDLGHVLGYMNEVSQKDLSKWPGVYRPGEYIGRSGVERSFEESLRGEYGRRVVARNSSGDENRKGSAKASEGVKSVSAQDGNDLWLTLDVDLQGILRHSLRYQNSGAVVVMEPYTGEILGMFSKPEFDPNVWSGRLTRAEKEKYDQNPYAPMINKATTGYAPGSIYKVVTALAGLEEGVIHPSSSVECPGFYLFGGRKFRCHQRSGHGEDIDLSRSMALSCDIYYYKLGETLGMDQLAHYGEEIFGLGMKTGIDIYEQGGRIPSKDWYREHGRIGWQPGFTLSVAVGQGALTSSPLQMARMYSSLINGGFVYRPLISKQVVAQDGKVLKRFRPEVQKQLPFSEEAMGVIRDSLTRVVNDPEEGTGQLAAIERLKVAGKTGTAEAKMFAKGVSKDVAEWLKEDHAWFAAYAPAENPEIVVIVFVEHGGSGGKIAAPIAKYVIEQYFDGGFHVSADMDAPGGIDEEEVR